MYNKDRLMKATMDALTSKNTFNPYNKNDHKKKLKKLVEDFANNNDISTFLDVLISSTTDEELSTIVEQLTEKISLQ